MSINQTSLRLVLLALASGLAAFVLLTAAITVWSLRLACFSGEAALLATISFALAHYVAVHQPPPMVLLGEVSDGRAA